MNNTFLAVHRFCFFTASPVPAEGLEVGGVGRVVHVYPDGKAFEVEFTTLDGKTASRREASVPT